MAVVAKFEGARQFEQALGDLTKATARNVLRRALTKAAKPVQEAMEARAPRDSGWTAGSIAVSNTLNPANRSDQKKEGKSFAEVYVGSTRGSAGILQEWGTYKMPAQPYMRPAWDATKGGVMVTFGRELKNELDKAAARAAKKAARFL
jgi:HK97 gp10 family phage protein